MDELRQKESLIYDKDLSAEMIPGFNVLAAGRSVYLEINLDVMVDNLKIGDAAGHGAVDVSRFLKTYHPELAPWLAVGTLAEGVELRDANIPGPILVFGNVQSWEMAECLHHNLVPSVSTSQAILGMAQALQEREISNLPQWPGCSHARGSVHINVDTGMTRNGCNPQDLPHLVKMCKDKLVPLHGIYSHLSTPENSESSKHQVEKFEKCITPFRNDGYVFHLASSVAVVNRNCPLYDMVRTSALMRGFLNASNSIKPAMSMKGKPTLIRKCSAGTKVGYGGDYECREDTEWIATFPVGYGDGYSRALGFYNTYIIRDKTGEQCPLVGKVSMDAITVRLPCPPDLDETFTIIPADYSPASVWGMRGKLPHGHTGELLIRLGQRLPRLYISENNGLRYVRNPFRKIAKLAKL